jgi:hypothetical protein
VRLGLTPDDRRRYEAQLDAIEAGDKALAELLRLKRRRDWSGFGRKTGCGLCRLRRWHTIHIHELLLHGTVRRLPREAYNSSVKLAEENWRRATGEKLRMEAILERELRREKPTSFRKLAANMGVAVQTVTRWARFLGIDIPLP